MTTSLAPAPTARQIEIAWRWPPESRRTRWLTDGTLIDSRDEHGGGAPVHRPPVEQAERPDARARSPD